MCMCELLFFCFKQKTAYEMRISDWSSDVCSSDLVVGRVTIVSDRPLLMRALANLLSNSYKYTDSGGASITLAPKDGSAGVTNRDSGGGIPAEIVAAPKGGPTPRNHAREKGQGSGSGLRPARPHIQQARGAPKHAALSKEDRGVG